jgi:cytochrome c biogenesis protein CcdA
MDLALLLWAFSAGLVATVNPCGFAMLPAYMSYYLATDDHEPLGVASTLGPQTAVLHAPHRLHEMLSRLLPALLVGGTLTAGFLGLFVVGGTLISLGAYAVVRAMPWIGLGVGLGLVLLGGWLLLGHHLRLPGLPQFQVQRERTLRSIFLFGVAYGLASLSCTLPVFLAVVGSAFTQRGVGVGLLHFLAYGLGMGAVLMALTLSLSLCKGALVRYLLRLVPYVERAGAVLLLGAGAYIIYYWLVAGGMLRVVGLLLAGAQP